MNMETLHIYTRVSSKSQGEDGTSLESQKEMGIRESKRRGMLYEIHNENVQSSSLEGLENRPIIQQLLNRIEEDEIKHLFVYHHDRLSRNEQTSVLIRKKLRDNNVTVYTKDGVSNLTNPMDDFIFGILSEVSKFDNSLRTQRLKEGKIKRGLEGFWFGGPTPFGYMVGPDKKLIEDPKQGQWVRKIFKLYGEGTSPWEIKLSLDGYVKTNRNKDTWSLGSIYSVLKNTHYNGFYTFNGTQLPCPKIVKDEDFLKVQKRLDIGKKDNSNNDKHTYLLRPILFCGHCERRMGGYSNKGNRSTVKLMYRCNKKHNDWRETTQKGDWTRGKNVHNNYGCTNNRSLDRDKTDDVIWDIVCETVGYSKLTREKFKQITLNKGKISKDDKRREKQSLQRKIKSIQKDIDKLEITLSQVELDKVLKRENVSINKTREKVFTDEITKLNNQLSQYEMELENLIQKVEWVDWYDDYLKDIEDIRKLKGDDRLKYIQRYVERIDVYLEKETSTHRLEIKFHLPIVNDRLKWKNPKSKKEGYQLYKGRDMKVVFLKKNIRLTRKDVVLVKG